MKFIGILIVIVVMIVDGVINLVPRRGINVLNWCSWDAGGVTRSFSSAMIKRDLVGASNVRHVSVSTVGFSILNWNHTLEELGRGWLNQEDRSRLPVWCASLIILDTTIQREGLMMDRCSKSVDFSFERTKKMKAQATKKALPYTCEKWIADWNPERRLLILSTFLCPTHLEMTT